MTQATSPSLPLIPAGETRALSNCPLAAQAFLLATSSQRPLIHVAAHDKDAEQWLHLLRFYAPQSRIFHFPAWDCLPYDRVSPSHTVTATRLATLAAMAHDPSNAIVVTTVNAITQRLPPRSVVSDASLQLKRGDTLHHDAFMAQLARQGYQRTGKVMEQGEFAVRGSIIDLFPANLEQALRIDLFDNEIESLRLFDPLTQISGETIDQIQLQPISEILLSDTHIDRFRTRYREMFAISGKNDPLYEAISEGRTYAGAEHWLPLFYEKLSTLPDYLPGALISYDANFGTIHKERSDAIHDYFTARRSHAERKGEEPTYQPIPPESLFILPEAWQTLTSRHPCLSMSTFRQESTQNLACNLPPAPSLYHERHGSGGNVWELIAQRIKSSQTPNLFACNSQGSLERFDRMLKEHGYAPARIAEGIEIIGLPPEQPGLTVLPIEHGFIHPRYTLFSEQDALGERIIRTTKRRKASTTFMAEAASYAPGDFVVHREHGIGRFEGLVTLEAGGARHDCLKLIYADDARLFLPVENIDLITRYGSSEGNVELDKLGGVNWQKRKAVLKNRLKMAAEALLKIAAERALRQGQPIQAAQESYDEFTARFPYTETDDQLQSIEDVLEDLRSGNPMDRLICGDVGFGKTEVAMRAAFAAVTTTPKMQVAIIAPTTLLARQHFNSFSQRFRGFPIRIHALSRLVSAKDTRATKEAIRNGEADIVIGTHALLSKEITFKNLGLLIIDEEQHFGVAQKEKLKSLKSEVHVLTLSATPIPRTLQLALSGVRELSLITTPPIDRLAVRTYVMPFDSVVIREAILREYHRGGKIFYVTPRVKYMAELKVKLEALVPEIRIAAAHGQMSATELDRIMNDFYDGKYDLLLSTTIIESGIDIPTANTIIIDRADMFGLSQLYQLRGRVGRSKQRAYAYFTLPHGKLLTHEATRRLEVMQQLDSLGAGFQLASHDMDIRGFGNVLGEEQSGHIREVGIELYQSMLEEAIAEHKRHTSTDIAPASEQWSPTINIGSTTLIPESYVNDLQLRLGLYRRAAAFTDEADIEGFAVELVDRFGPLHEEVEHFLEVLRIKLWCKRAGIERIDAGPKGAVLSFRDNAFSKPEALILLAQKQAHMYRLRADQKLVVVKEWPSSKERMKGVEAATRHIAELAA